MGIDSIDEQAQRVLTDKVKERFSCFTGDGKELKELTEFYSRETGLLEQLADDIRLLEPSDIVKVLADRKKAEDERTGDLLGYPLNKFSNLAKDIDGLQAGLYVFGGHTNVGKTGLLLNLFLDAIETNPKLYGLFFSLDDNTDRILGRILAIKADNLSINDISKPRALDKKRLEARETAYQVVKVLADRFRIEDSTKIQSFEILEYHLRTVLENKIGGKELVIAIDGLQNLDTGENEQNIREKNITRANFIKGLVNRYSVPILTTVELRKRASGSAKESIPTTDDIMETGKFAYNANFLGTLNIDDSMDYSKVSLRACMPYGKNKLSGAKIMRYLNFDYGKATITEGGEIEIGTRAEETPKRSKGKYKGNTDYSEARL